MRTALLVTAFLVPSVAAWNPLDHDTGGGDAGDDPSHATPIEFGSVAGNLWWPLDRYDFYALTVNRPMVVDMADQGSGAAWEWYDPSGWLFEGGLLDPGATNAVYLPRAGTWYLALFSYGPLRIPYALRVAPQPAAPIVLFEGDLPEASVVEVAWSEPGTLHVLAWRPNGNDSSDPNLPLVYVESVVQTAEGPQLDWAGCWTNIGAYGQEISVQPSPIPPQPFPFRPQSTEPGGWCTISGDLPEGVGWLRFVGVHTGSEARQHLTVLADVELRHATWRGTESDLTTWQQDKVTAASVVTPFALTGPSCVNLGIQRSFIGAFDPFPVVGTMQSPDGTTTVYPHLQGVPPFPYLSEFLRWPASGQYEFCVPADAGYVQEHFAGLHVPWLGVAPPPGQGT